jgi:hypothetical protein
VQVACILVAGIACSRCAGEKQGYYASFQELVNKAIVLDSERQEMDRKRKMKGQGSGNNTRQRTNSQHGFHPRFQGLVS